MKTGRRLGNGWVIGTVIALCTIAAGWISIPGILQSNRAANERAALAALRTIASAEDDFRAHDRDGNGVNDSWTGDVAGFFNLVVRGQEIQLIERAVAEADTAPLRPLVKTPRPYHGYFFVTLKAGIAGDGPTYGICAYPARPAGPRRTGVAVYLWSDSRILQRYQRVPPTTLPTELELRAGWTNTGG